MDGDAAICGTRCPVCCSRLYFFAKETEDSTVLYCTVWALLDGFWVNFLTCIHTVLTS